MVSIKRCRRSGIDLQSMRHRHRALRQYFLSETRRPGQATVRTAALACQRPSHPRDSSSPAAARESRYPASRQHGRSVALPEPHGPRTPFSHMAGSCTAPFDRRIVCLRTAARTVDRAMAPPQCTGRSTDSPSADRGRPFTHPARPPPTNCPARSPRLRRARPRRPRPLRAPLVGRGGSTAGM